MSVELCVLASGSSGNCSVVRTPAGVVLFDLGIGPRALGRRLVGAGVSIAEISAVCLTHLDRDHFSPHWASTLLKHGIALHCHRSRVEDINRLVGHPHLLRLIHPFDSRPFDILPGVSVQPVGLAHDADGSHGFVLDAADGRLGYATDLGQVPAGLLDAFCDLNLLAIESNYDADMQIASTRPTFLKQRIMGGHGHLSNRQAFDAIKRVLDRCQKKCRPLPSHIVLLHRSAECNCPDLVRRYFARDARIAPRLVLAEQHERTDWLRARDIKPHVGEQLMLAWG